jgi:hypothetical protein
VTLLCALVIAIPSAVLASMLKSSYFCLQVTGVVLIIGFLALDDYISLVNAALMGLDASNTWAQTYANTYILDTFTMVIRKFYYLLKKFKLKIIFFKSTESLGNFI